MVVLTSFGARIGLISPVASVIARIRATPGTMLAVDGEGAVDVLYRVRLTARPAHVTRFELLRDDDATLVDTTDEDEVRRALENDLHFQIAVHARTGLFVHAGVVAWKRRAIVIPGRSMTGKSTLVAALVEAGAVYYSDEFAVFDPAGRVQPYRTPLSLRDGRGGRFILNVPTPESDPGEPLRVGMIVSTGYRAEHRWRPRRLTVGRAALALVDNAVPARLRPEDTVATMARAAAGALAISGLRPEARALAPRLLRALDRHAASGAAAG